MGFVLPRFPMFQGPVARAGRRHATALRVAGAAAAVVDYLESRERVTAVYLARQIRGGREAV